MRDILLIASASGRETLSQCIARASQSVMLAADGAIIPDEIQWMPPGQHDVEPFVEGEPRTVQGMCVNAGMAEAFNRQLQHLRSEAAAGRGDVPFIDFNHNDDTSAGEVLALYWGGEDPQSGGIRAKVKWSAAGRAALEGKNYRRFSPQWFLDPETSEPLGVGINLGGLVNRAAFKTIARVVAKDASASTHKPKPDMTKEEFQQLLADGLKPINDKITVLEAKASAAPAAGATAITAQAAADEKMLQLVTTAMKPITDKLTVFETAQQNSVKAQAKASVQPHITRGAIAPEDTKTIEFWENAYVANASQAETMLAKMPGKTITRIIRGGGGSHTQTGAPGEHAFLAKAREYAKANDIKNGVQAVTAYASTAEGRELYEQYRKDVIPVKAN